MRAFPEILGASNGRIHAGRPVEPGLIAVRPRHLFLLAPLVLMATTLAVFRLLIPLAGETAAYFAGFAFYWLLGGIILPVLLIGRDGVTSLFARRAPALNPGFLAALVLLAASVVFGFLFAFPYIFPVETGVTLASLAAYAIVNGTSEEIFWRGTFAQRFPTNRWLGMFYPAVMFSCWHLVPWVVFPLFLHVSALAVIAAVFPIALVYHWVAWSTGSIRWTVLTHVLTNMSGLGAMVIFGPGW